MKLQFRHGLVRWQTDISGTQSFLQKSSLSGDYINLIISPDPTIFTVAHGRADYLIEETKTVVNAWGPFQAVGQTQYLYWDVNVLDGTVTRNYTIIPPSHGPVEPINPVNDQHWFDTINFFMKVWNGTKWIIKVRIFAAIYNQNAVIIPLQATFGSQVNLNTTCSAGHIILNDVGNPLRDRDGALLTTESSLLVNRSATSPIILESAIIHVEAMEHVPAYYLVSFVANKKAVLASSARIDRQVAGIVIEDMYQGEIRRVVINGNVTNEQWNWPDATIGRPVFCGLTGEVTLVSPIAGVSQQVGLVFDHHTITFNIMQAIKR